LYLNLVNTAYKMVQFLLDNVCMREYTRRVHRHVQQTVVEKNYK